MEQIIHTLSPLLRVLYILHDVVSDFLAAHFGRVKQVTILLAHLTLFGFLFPEWRKEFGELAANLLIFILFLSPLSRIFRMRILLQLMSLRRELGIMMGYLATVHGIGYLIDPDWFAYIVKPILNGDVWGYDPRYLFGILAYLLTLPLLITSNTLSQRLMGTRWKALHRIVYLMFVLAIIHRFLVKGAPIVVIFEIVLLLSAYGLAKLLAWRNFLTPPRELIRLVGEDYRQYKNPPVPVASAPL